MFVLGFLYWMYSRDMDNTMTFLKEKFGKKPEIFESNMKVLQAGYNFGDTTETFSTIYKVEKAKMQPGVYRSVMGNQALAYGLIAASQKAVFLCSLVPTRSHPPRIYCMSWPGIKISE